MYPKTRPDCDVSAETLSLDFFEHLVSDLMAIFTLRICSLETNVFSAHISILTGSTRNTEFRLICSEWRHTVPTAL
jgi:hypothetical protein